MVGRIGYLAIILMLIVLMVQSVSAATLQAVADRDRLAMGESLNLELRVKGSLDDDPDFSVLETNWEILSRSQSSQIQLINGSMRRSVVFSLTLMPKEQGELLIPPLCADGICSTALPIRVTAQPQRVAGSSDPLRLEVEATPQTLYSQQQLLVTVRLLHRVDLRQGSLSEPQPQGVDAVVQKLGDDRNGEVRRDGLLYQMIERRYAIFPQQSGQLRLPPLQFDGEIASAPSRFDPFGSRGERVRRTSAPLEVTVLPPPAGVGADWLPASSLQLSDDWQSGAPPLVVGEPATRTLTLSAEGIPAAQLPELTLALPEGFKSYPDQPGRSDSLTANGLRSTLQQKVALVPTRPGYYRLPPIDLRWWDVKANTWRQAHLAAVELDVAAAPNAAPAAEPTAVSAPSASISEVPTSASFWPWLALGLGLGWAVTLVLLWRRRSAVRPVLQEDDVETLREKQARREALKAAQSGDPQQVRQALQCWSRTLFPEAGEGALSRLAASDPAWAAALNRLQRSLYGPTPQGWDGAEIVILLRQRKDEAEGRRPKEERLPPLYPPEKES